MNTIKRQMTKTIEKMIENALKEIKINKEEERKKKKLYAKFLKLIKPMIIEMLQEGYEIKMINQIINDTFKININYITFYRWVKRNITKKEIEVEIKNCANAQTKSNIKGSEVNKTTPKEKEIKPKNKEIKNENAEVKEKKAIDPIKILNNDNITAIDSEYKDLL